MLQLEELNRSRTIMGLPVIDSTSVVAIDQESQCIQLLERAVEHLAKAETIQQTKLVIDVVKATIDWARHRQLIEATAKRTAEETIAAAKTDAMNRWLTVAQAAEVMQCSKLTVRRMIDAGRLEAHYIGEGGDIRLLWSEVLEATKKPGSSRQETPGAGVASASKLTTPVSTMLEEVSASRRN